MTYIWIFREEREIINEEISENEQIAETVI